MSGDVYWGGLNPPPERMPAHSGRAVGTDAVGFDLAAERQGVTERITTIASQLERDRREPDKVLCYVQALRRLEVEVERHREGVAEGHAIIRGKCPACGSRSLFLGSGGYVTCSWLSCPNPGAASDHLEAPVVERQITEDARSAVVLVAPTSADVNCGWQGMALAGGKVVNSIVGGSRAVVLEDCVDALGAALGAPSQPDPAHVPYQNDTDRASSQETGEPAATVPVMALRPDERFPDELDDVVVENVTMFRAEAMDDDDFWLECYFANGERIAFSMTIGKKPKRLVLRATEMPSEWEDYDARSSLSPNQPEGE